MSLKFEKWMALREQQEGRNEVERTMRDANAAIDKAFTFLLNSIKKSYGGGAGMHAGMRDELIADLRGVMQKIASFEPKVAAESLELIDKALMIEQEAMSADRLGITGRDVGGERKYGLEKVMMAVRDKIKNMMQFVVTKIADIKMGGATGKIGSRLDRLRGQMGAGFTATGGGVEGARKEAEAARKAATGISGELGDLPGQIAAASRPPLTHDELSNIDSGLNMIGGEFGNLRALGIDTKGIKFYTGEKGGMPIQVGRKDKSPVYSLNVRKGDHFTNLASAIGKNYGRVYIQVPGISRRFEVDLKSVHAPELALQGIRRAVGGESTGGTGAGTGAIPGGMYPQVDPEPIKVARKAKHRVQAAPDRGYGSGSK